MVTRTVDTEHDRSMLIRFIEGHKVPFIAELTAGKRRSIEQNKLQRKWMTEISEQLGDRTPEEVRAYCKLTIGVPLLREENETFREKYDAVVRPMPYEQKIAIMSEPLDMPVTRLMTSRQKHAYLGAIFQHFSEKGIVLTIPPDKRFGPPIEQEPSSPAVPPVDDVGSGDSSPPVPAADESEMQPPAGEKIRATQDGSMGTTSTTGQSPVGVVPTESVSSSQAADLKLSDEDRAWLKTITRMLWAATAVGEQDLLKNTYQGARENQTPPGISKAARDRGNSIYLKCKLVCFGEKDAGETLEAIALVACVEPREIVS